MLRYLLLLSAALFLTLTIAGHDRGQVRLGLTGAYDPPPPVPLTPARPAPPAAEAVARTEGASVVLAAFSPEPPAARPAPTPAAEPAVAAAAAAEPSPASAVLPLMWVDASAVNLRAAPSTDAAVLDRLSRNEAVSVVGPGPEGWLRVRLEGDGGEGFVAARYLTDRDPAAN